MNRSLQIAFVTSMLVLLSGSVSGKTGHEVGPEPTLSIHLYDQAQLPADMLRLATAEATRLFRAAGIQISWERPLVEAPEDRGIDLTGAGSRRIDERPYFVVRLVRRIPASVFPDALGFALPFARIGAHVSIFMTA